MCIRPDLALGRSSGTALGISFTWLPELEKADLGLVRTVPPTRGPIHCEVHKKGQT